MSSVQQEALDRRYSIILDNSKETMLSSRIAVTKLDNMTSGSTTIGSIDASKSSYDSKGYSDYYHYPKIIYKVYERYGDKLILSTMFSSYSYANKEDALLAIRRIGTISTIYVLLEEVSLFGYSM